VTPLPNPGAPEWEGVFEPLDLRFAEVLARHDPTADAAILVAAAAASRALQRGDICLDLETAAEVLRAPEVALKTFTPPPLPAAEGWARHLLTSSLVSDGSQPTPLIVRDGRVYLHRYFDYQRRFAEAVRVRRKHTFDVHAAASERAIDALFGDDPEAEPRRAAQMAVNRALTIVSGGPGTGKTTTILKILAVLLSVAEAPDKLKIVLAAPTGKAAARMSESIRDGIAALALPPHIARLIPQTAATIHRLLLSVARSDGGAAGELQADVVVIDEASMVDLALMTRLIEMVRPDARLILLGDKDQLASVQAGRVLIDLVAASGPEAPLADNVVEFTRTYRFGGAIGRLADAVREGDVEAAMAVFEEGSDAVQWMDLQPSAIIDFATEGWRTYFQHLTTPEAALDALGRFQVLAAHRRGPYGVESIAANVRQQLAEKGIISKGNPWDEWFHGRAVLVTTNDQALQLWNGDVGVALADETGTPRVYFPAHPGDTEGVRSLGLGQLPPVSPWWAVTIHKAQGSGFDHAVVVLPPEPSPLCTRELLYTAVTRARTRVTVISTAATLTHTIATATTRASGLTAGLFV